MATATHTVAFTTNRAHTAASMWAAMRARVRGLATFEVTRPKDSKVWEFKVPKLSNPNQPMAASRGLEGGKGSKILFFASRLPRRGCKKRTASRPLFGGLRVALADLGDLTDPGQLNGQGPVLF